MTDEPRRYYYIVWCRDNAPALLNMEIIDQHPADWLADNFDSLKPPRAVIVNQFEITAEQFQRLESLQ